MNAVTQYRPPNPYTLSSQQQGGEYNYNRAQADYQGDPRYNAKAFQKAGLSSSKGTAALGASPAANAYAAGLAGAEAGAMKDAYANANLTLDDQSQRSQFGMALAGLQEDMAQRNYMHNMRMMQNAMNNSPVSPFGSSNASSLLAGLY